MIKSWTNASLPQSSDDSLLCTETHAERSLHRTAFGGVEGSARWSGRATGVNGCHSRARASCGGPGPGHKGSPRDPNAGGEVSQKEGVSLPAPPDACLIRLETRELDILHPPADIAQRQYDVVVAADCLYHAEVAASLGELVAQFYLRGAHLIIVDPGRQGRPHFLAAFDRAVAAGAAATAPEWAGAYFEDQTLPDWALPVVSRDPFDGSLQTVLGVLRVP